MLEILMGAMGDKRRWRTMPWMVTFFGILVVPLGVVSIYFIIIQPIVIGTWCTLCLLAALAMLIMIPFALDELVAMGQFLVWSRHAGKSLWRMFFMGGALEGGKEGKAVDLGSVRSAMTGMISGMTLPWTLVASVILGTWLMFTRLSFGTVPPMADSDHLVGGAGGHRRRNRDGRSRAAAAFRQRVVRRLACRRAVDSRERVTDSRLDRRCPRSCAHRL